MEVVDASISFHGRRGTLTTTEASTTSMEAPTTSMEASIVLMEALTSFHESRLWTLPWRVSTEVDYGRFHRSDEWSFHGSSPKLLGKLLPQGWRQLLWKCSRLPVEACNTSVEASTEVAYNFHGSGRSFHRKLPWKLPTTSMEASTASTEAAEASVKYFTCFHGSGGSFDGSGGSSCGSRGSFHGSFHELPS